MQDPSRTIGHEEHKIKIKPVNFQIPHFLYFESVIPSKRRIEFKNAENSEWTGPESVKELFDIWKKLKHNCKENATQVEITTANKQDKTDNARNVAEENINTHTLIDKTEENLIIQRENKKMTRFL